MLRKKSYMKKAWRPVLLSVALALLSACGQDGVLSSFFGGCIADAQKHINKADWGKTRTISIRIRQDEFEPMVFRLVQNRPYILVINNGDDSLHYFRAWEFFRSIALDQVTSGGQIFNGNCTAAVAIEPRKKIELRFVAVRDGRYDFEDNPHLLSFVRLGSASSSISIEPEKIQLTKFLIHRPPKPTKATPVAPVRAAPIDPVQEQPGEGLFGAPVPEEPPAKPDEGLFDAPVPKEPPAKPTEGLFDSPVKPPAALENRAPGRPGEGLFDEPISKPPSAPG